jgi:glycerol-3-phosphate dehydrogenase
VYDSIIIGAGIVGCAVARELAKYTASVCVLEKNEDLCEGTSKANSAIVHAGYDAAPGSQKARFNALGNRLYPSLAAELEVPFGQNGSLVLCLSEETRPILEELLVRGEQNGIERLRIVEREELKSMEPHVSDNAVCALYAPTGGIVCPFTMCAALAENACANGAEFHFEQEAIEIEQTDRHFSVRTTKATYEGKTIVNAAGVYADKVAKLAGGHTDPITPRRGEYCVLDKRAGNLVRHTLFQLPGPTSKGVLVTPTVHGNLLIGPNAEDILDTEDTSTTHDGLKAIVDTAALSVDAIPPNMIIASYAGLRAHPESGDFHIGEDDTIKGLYHAAGIESPGLTAAPAIAHALVESIAGALDLKERPEFKRERKAIAKFVEMSGDEREKALEENPAYGNIVCRCETVSEAEVVEAICRMPGARTLDGVKRRTRAGTGRCQAGFCLPRISAILARELNVPLKNITKMGGCSAVIIGPIKQEEPCER